MAKDRPSSSNSKMSPVKNKRGKTAPTQVGLQEDRENMVFDLDEVVPEVEKSFFDTYLLPPSPLPTSVSVESLIPKLREKGSLTQEGTWKGWKEPKNSIAKEDEVFRGFEGLVKMILEAYELVDKTITTTFKCNPALQLWSHMRTNSSKPDSYGIRSDAKLVYDRATRKEQPQWIDVAVPGEFKKNNLAADCNDDATKVLWSMNHIMREDVRRRFVLGFTIENTSMRYWFCSRSDVFVSKPFDMLTEPSKLVDFIFRVCFANDHELGWDASITLYEPHLRIGKPPQYIIKVRDDAKETTRAFRTLRIISNDGADALRGRGTRVWEVIELDEKGKDTTGKPCVLKDVWVDDDRAREGAILAQIHADADAQGEDSDHKMTMDACLLTTLTYGDVHLYGTPDKTRNWAYPEIKALIKVSVDPKSTTPVQQSQPVVGGMSLEADPGANTRANDDSPKLVTYSLKTHHRVVFKEVGKTIREVGSLSQSFKYLCQAIFAVRILHELGWVHRDLSGGNILIVDGFAKIADLEYAKHKNDTSTRGVRTGTPYFMSTEVDANCYLHIPEQKTLSAPAPDQRSARFKALFKPAVKQSNTVTNEATGTAAADKTGQSSSHNVDTTKEATDTATAFGKTKPRAPPVDAQSTVTVVPFKYNPLHDMESILWLALYILLSGRLVADGATSDDNLDLYTLNQRALAWKLCENKNVRTKVMGSPGYLATLLNSAELLPRVRQIAGHLDQICSSLRAAYNVAEKDLAQDIPFTVAQNLYGEYDGHFDLIQEILVGGEAGKKAEDITVAIDEASRDYLRKMLKRLNQANQENQVDDSDEASGADGEGSSSRPSKKQKMNDSDKQRFELRAQVVNDRRRSDRLQEKPSSAP